MKELLEELKELTDWLLFGKVIGIPQAQLHAIIQDGADNRECKRLVFERWIKLEQPTWNKVISSLFKCGMTTVGWELAKKYGKHHNNFHIFISAG